MEMKKILIGAALGYGCYLCGKGNGYLSCMRDVATQHSDILPDGKLTLKSASGKKRYSITVSKPKTKES